MEALAVTLGIVPYLSGRTLFAVGIVLSWFALQGVWREGELSVKAMALGIAAGIVSLAVQAVAAKLREGLESLAESARATMRRLDALVTTVIALLFAAYLLGMLSRGIAQSSTSLGMEVRQASVTGDALVLLMVGVAAYTFARLRAWLADLFDLVPLSEVEGIRRALLLAESAWTVAGVLVALLLPLLGLLLAMLTFLFLVGLALVLREATRGAQGKCAACGAETHLAASTCRTCKAARAPKALGMLGRVLDKAPPDLGKHRLALLAARRCPSCADRLVTHEGETTCPSCRQPTFRDQEEAKSFVRYVDARLAALVPVFVLFGLVPILGLCAALVLYKISPAGALGGFVGWRHRLRTRVLRGLAMLALAFLQPVPVVGVLAVLAVIAIVHAWARRSFLATFSKSAGEVAPAPAPAAGATG
ncbi:MAG: hypothetical protein HY901_07055 [Deltaproteobacteria bacterium]|nr:hypothetical protein [Deltaproteobacteria bacterium]